MKSKIKNFGLINIFSLLILFIGIIMHIIPYFYNRSLWVDEAYLASSIGTRNLGNLVLSPLDYGQSAPIGYLYIVKLLSVIFGMSEAVLRIWSLISFIGVLFLFYLILKVIFETKYALLYTGFLSIIPYYIYYSNEFKQYMSDCMFVLLAVFLFGLYLKSKISLKTLVISYAVVIWFSFAAVFFIAAGMIYLVIKKFYDMAKNKRFSMTDVKYLLLCLTVAVSFVLNYILWLSKTSENVGGQGYWSLLKFPIIPTSKSDLALIYRMLLQILSPLRVPYLHLDIIIPLLDIYALIILIKKKNAGLILTVTDGGVLLLLASAMGFYPIQDRLVLFVAILMLIFAAVGMEYIFKLCVKYFKSNKHKIVRVLYYAGTTLLLITCIAVPVRTSAMRILPSGSYAYKNNSEVADNIIYLNNILDNKDNIYIYIYIYIMPQFLYLCMK